MARFCGGLNFDQSLKILKGVICDAGATSVDVANAVSTCGQLWDGALFTKAKAGSSPVITLHNSEGDEVGTPTLVKGNCGVGLDGRFFKIANGVVSLQDGFLLTVVTDPDAASVKVVDADSVEVEPTEVGGKTYLLAGIGDQYGVNVEYTGYTGKHLTITNDKDQTLNVTLEETPQA